jgi:hypothetical protein
MIKTEIERLDKKDHLTNIKLVTHMKELYTTLGMKESNVQET